MPTKTKTFRPPQAAAERADAIRRYNRTPERVEAMAFYSSARWRRLAAMVLRRQPICTDCQREPSTVVHHDKPRRDYPDLAYDIDNLIGLCASCHSRLEARLRATGGG